MTLTSRTIKIHKLLCCLMVFGFLATPAFSFAAGLSLSITPTLFEMSAKPLQRWDSAIKVINGNKQPLTVYAEVVNFMPQGETGYGKFMPVFENFTEGKTLAEWITVPDGPITIPTEGTVSVPVTVEVPEDAAPGGHYAAIMIKTQPPVQEDAFHIGTSQAVTSLFLVRIAGDVVENGSIRTFRVEDSFVGLPEATFEVRFENKGNVHLQPQGEILISNMWGRERGVIPINQQTHFGNVLPESIRKFNFTWKGEPSFTDIGRYKAQLTLAYGQEGRKFSTQSTYFWVIPVKQVLTVLGVLLFIILFTAWAIRSYVRRMLSISTTPAYVPPSQRARVLHEGDVLIERKPSVTAPLGAGVKDLRSRLEHTSAFIDTLRMLVRFIWSYKLFFGGVLVALLLAVLVWHFFSQVTQSQRDYEVTIDNPDAEVTLSSEEIMYAKEQRETQAAVVEQEIATSTDLQPYELILTNSSDTPGAAATLQSALEEEGYSVAQLYSDFGESKERTVIIYDAALVEDALTLSKLLDGALLSARPEDATTDTANITVFIGNDYEFELE